MSFAFNGLNAQVTISGQVSTQNSFATPSSTQTIVRGTVAGTGSSGVAYTVPANKVFYLTGLWIEEGNRVQFFKGATWIFSLKCASTQTVAQSFNTPLEVFTAGEELKGAGTNGVYYGYWGYLVDA